MVAISPVASAHEWFEAKTNPVTGARCCGGTDCAVVPAALFEWGAITETPEGYIVRLTVPEAQIFNKAARAPINQLVPWKQVQPSESGRFALCIWRDEVKCFFAPQNS
jgi:hypothetical protein